MAKILLTTSNLDDFICQAANAVFAQDLIITAGAKDELCRRHISIVYDPKPQSHGPCEHATHCPHPCSPSPCGDLENLLVSVAAVLKKEYGVTNPDQLRSLTCDIVKQLKNAVH